MRDFDFLIGIAVVGLILGGLAVAKFIFTGTIF